jgi:hypothetical protein
MSDLLIRLNGTGGLATDWGLVEVDGDLVLTSSHLEEVAQRVVYRLMTWLRESPYDRSAGVPYLDGVFGFEPIEGVAGLLAQEILDVEGVDGFLEGPVFALDGRTLTVTATLQVGEEPLELTNLQVQAGSP